MEDATQQTQQTQVTIEAQLEDEKKAKAAAEASLAEKDARIAELQAEGEALRAERSNLLTSLSEAKTGSEAAAAELASTKEVKDRAMARYLDLAKSINPAIPEGIIAGDTIKDIDASVEKGKAIVESVKKTMEAESSQAKVPAGAPTRGEISVEGLTPREKIAAGIQQKGGT